SDRVITWCEEMNTVMFDDHPCDWYNYTLMKHRSKAMLSCCQKASKVGVEVTKDSYNNLPVTPCKTKESCH
ncbi:MAG: hypothetical protein ACUVSL_12970, partial [Chloroflexus sp.]|uniref:hypothetical protein n=1 Tax=Chloroflexus sp. TaxID=1904827 RepID=UPI00404AF0F5